MREEGASSDSEEELACLFPTVRQMVGIKSDGSFGISSIHFFVRLAVFASSTP